MQPRYLARQIQEDLARKMVLVAGPRQVGKTTLARSLLTNDEGYLNWDVAEHREQILRRELPAAPVLVFDEIHKYRSWRNYLKGLYDHPQRRSSILVTGSARLDYYRRGGDSLQGRYHFLRLHPFSVSELGIRDASGLEQLLALGGFPEPFLSGSEEAARRWSREYRSLLIREEIVSLEQVTDLGNLELLMLRLPELVGSPLSLNALREDLQVSFRAVQRWVSLLERFYAVFRVAPHGGPKIRAVKKAAKHYHLDWSVVPEPAARFENLVACHLLKWVHHEQDTRGRDLDLGYLRDVTGREADFVITEGRKPVTIIECKLADAPLDPALRYFAGRFPNTAAWQISARGKKDYQSPEGIRVAPCLKFLCDLS